MKRTMICCAAFLSLTACERGDFCDVVPGPKLFDPGTGAVMIQTDRDDVAQIRVENEYGQRHCSW